VPLCGTGWGVPVVTQKGLLSWSGGKDSAMALYEIQRTGGYEISALLTTVTADYDRVSMHGVRRILLEQQAASLGLPLEEVLISADMSSEEYGAKMREVLESHRARGVSSVVFGDVFLEDVRTYREENLSKVGMRGIFPLWGRDTGELARTFVDLGFEAVITCVDTHLLDGGFVGRVFDRQFLSELPAGVDPCGENGAFHSFVYDGPVFGERIAYTKGEMVLRENRFQYCDLMPVQVGESPSGLQSAY
jgi:uncharacterized protein (TIGR00290 family)